MDFIKSTGKIKLILTLVSYKVHVYIKYTVYINIWDLYNEYMTMKTSDSLGM